EGKAAATGSFVFDAFDLADKHVEAVEYPQLTGQFHFRYAFNVTDAAGNLVERIALQSDDIDQQKWAQEHPAQAAAGGRMFSLDSYHQTAPGQQAHGLIRFYNEGEPTYEEVSTFVKEMLAGKNP